MNDIIHFITTHYELIINCFIAIVSIVFFILRKKPLNALNGVLIEWCIDAVKLAENTTVKGDEKLTIAVRYVIGKLHDLFPSVKTEDYIHFVIQQIEDILSTPQKKK